MLFRCRLDNYVRSNKKAVPYFYEVEKESRFEAQSSLSGGEDDMPASHCIVGKLLQRQVRFTDTTLGELPTPQGHGLLASATELAYPYDRQWLGLSQSTQLAKGPAEFL